MNSLTHFLWLSLFWYASTPVQAMEKPDEAINPNMGDPNGHLSTDKFTIFSFAQTDPDRKVKKAINTALIQLKPDINIRAWQKWSNNGLKAEDYDFSLIEAYRKLGITFIGGGTASALFQSEMSPTRHLQLSTKDTYNQPVPYANGRFNGSFANPDFRDHVFSYIAKQIDGGVDGVFLDEVMGTGCSGGPNWRWSGNECFDQHHIQDFTQYLLKKYPLFTAQDWQKTFLMAPNNYPKKLDSKDVSNTSFDYRKYLLNHGWQKTPNTPKNPLAKEWGKIVSNRMNQAQVSFLTSAYRQYWQAFITRIRDYARETQNKEIYITSNGLFPFVDFNSFGLYEFNVDDDGKEAPYIPIINGQLNGRLSLQKHYQRIYQNNQSIAGNAPVVLFIDWPTKMMDDYSRLPLEQRKDFWRIYMAEAYANGLFFAFHLKTSIDSIPSATELGMMDFFMDYSQFYRDHANYFKDTVKHSADITTDKKNINTSLFYQPAGNRLLLHINNHNYRGHMIPQKNITIEIATKDAPTCIKIISPDIEPTASLPFQYTNQQLIVKLNQLHFYSVLEIHFTARC